MININQFVVPHNVFKSMHSICVSNVSPKSIFSFSEVFIHLSLFALNDKKSKCELHLMYRAVHISEVQNCLYIIACLFHCLNSCYEAECVLASTSASKLENRYINMSGAAPVTCVFMKRARKLNIRNVLFFFEAINREF